MPKKVPFVVNLKMTVQVKIPFACNVKMKCTQANLQRIARPTHLITNCAYRLKSHHTRNLYLRARLDTCVDVNIIPASVYRLVFKDPEMKKLATSSLEIGTYTTDTVQIVGSCMFYLVHPDIKKLMDVTFLVTVNDGNLLIPCKTTLILGLIQPRTRLNYLQPRASLKTSSADHPKKTKSTLCVQKQEVSMQRPTYEVAAQMPRQKCAIPKLVTSKEQILCDYPDVSEEIGSFPVPPYHIQVDSSVNPKQTPCHSIPVHLKEAFKQEVDKMLQAGVLKPVHEATPWINSFVLVESKDKLGNLKLHISLDPTNLNKAIIREPYHFRTPKDIAHLLADACIMTVCECKKGYWHQKLDEASSFSTTFNTEIGRFRYIVMPFGATVAGDVFQCKLDQCFGIIKQMIVIADDIMIVGTQQNHRDHDLALTTLLDTERKCNMRLNFDRLQYKKTKVDFFGETYTTSGCKPAQSKVSAITGMPAPTCKNKSIHSLEWSIIYQNSQ